MTCIRAASIIICTQGLPVLIVDISIQECLACQQLVSHNCYQRGLLHRMAEWIIVSQARRKTTVVDAS